LVDREKFTADLLDSFGNPIAMQWAENSQSLEHHKRQRALSNIRFLHISIGFPKWKNDTSHLGKQQGSRTLGDLNAPSRSWAWISATWIITGSPTVSRGSHQLDVRPVQEPRLACFHGCDVRQPAGGSDGSLRRLGAGAYDLNNDGWKDLSLATSDVMDNAELFSSPKFRQPNQIYVKQGNGTFSTGSGDGQMRRAHRGCAFGDFNNDGRVDVAVTSLNEPVELLSNVTEPRQHRLDLLLTGTRNNRDAIGAVIRMSTPSGPTQTNQVTTSVGYASSSSRRVHFGLDKETKAARVEIRWPSGATQTLQNVNADQILRITESR